jgi:transposase
MGAARATFSVEGQTLLADRVYDSERCSKASMNGRMGQHQAPAEQHVPAFSSYLYRYRNLVERFFNKIERYRAVATRYENRGLGYVPLMIEHKWHGDKTRRGYMSRWNIFVKNRFNP